MVNHKTVIFTLSMTNGLTLDLVYDPFDFDHTNLWFKSLEKFCNSKLPLTDTDRLYNFNPSRDSFISAIDNCNNIIKQLNLQLQEIQIPLISEGNPQKDINHIHTYFVDSDRAVEYTKLCDPILWEKLNASLHGLEAIERRKDSIEPQGQIFLEIPYREQYNLLDSSYQHFTIKKTFGYCYANYPHVGRHIYEMFQANDIDIDNDHIVPMNQIAGSSHLWFGKTTSDDIVDMKMRAIEKWFKENQISKKVNMEWGDPKLAIGWLPVARLRNNITSRDLINVEKVININIS